MVCRDAAVLENELRVAIAAMAHHRLEAADAKPCRFLVHKEERHSAPRPLLFVSDSQHDRVVRDVAVAYKMLPPVENEMIALSVRSGRDARRVRSSAGLGNSHAADAFTTHSR